MRIAVDLDGVLYNWSKTARYMLRTMKGYDKSGPLGQESQDWDYIKNHVEPEDWEWLWSDDGAIPLGLYRYGHVINGGIEGVRALAESGHTLVVATHRPAEAVQDTLDWLSWARLPFSGIHILTNQEPKSTVQADVLIDDKPANVIDWSDNTEGHAILFAQPWNASAQVVGKRLSKCNGWRETVAVVNLLQAWEDGFVHR